MTQLEKVIYTAKAHTTGAREEGASRPSEGRLGVKLTFPGTKGEGANPEQLSAVGWSSCYLSATKIVAAWTKVKLPPAVAVDAQKWTWTRSTAILPSSRLNVSLPGIDRETAQKLVDGAEVVVGDPLEPADVDRIVTGCWRVYFGMSVSAGYLGSDRDQFGGRSGIWSQRFGQHVANDSFRDEHPVHHAEPFAAAALAQR